MGRAQDLFGLIAEEDLPSAHSQISPLPEGSRDMHDGASPLTVGAPAAFLIRF